MMDNKLFLVLLRCPTLTANEIQKILVVFSRDITFETCAKELGVSRQNVEQTIKRGIKKLKEFYKGIDTYRIMVEV